MLTETRQVIRPSGYTIWAGIIQRCHNPNDSAFKHYGARGIEVCRRWRFNFRNFYRDMGPRPGRNYSIERVDVNKGYCPSNCKWIETRFQNRNTRRSRRLTLGRETLTVIEWSEKTGLSSQCILGRLKWGWTVEECLKTPSGHKRCRIVRFLGKLKSTQELAETFGIPAWLINKRLNRGWTLKRALTQTRKQIRPSSDLLIKLKVGFVKKHVGD